MDRIWKVYQKKKRSPNLKTSILNFCQDRILAFYLVLATSVVMIISLLLNILLKAVREVLTSFEQLLTGVNLDEVLIFKNIQIGVTFLMLYLMISVLFMILPSTTVRLRDIWLGSLLTSGLMIGLQQMISNSIIRIGRQYQSYGIVGRVMVLLRCFPD